MSNIKKQVTEETARKVLEVVDKGLCQGMGKPEPGMMCVEAAVCYAMGEPHGDNPSCVGSAVRGFKIVLNDANWSSKEARAKGMRRVAIAQLGSNKIDQKEFAEEVALQTIKQILPIALLAAAKMIPAHAGALRACALACELALDLPAAHAAADAAARAADAEKDSVLSKAAEIAVKALIKLGCLGASYLWMTSTPGALTDFVGKA